VSIVDSIAAHCVTGVERDGWITGLDHHRPKSKAEIGPDYASTLVPRALGAENGPPWQSPVKIGAATELIAKRDEPTARQGRKLFARKVVIAVRPHEVFALTCGAPRTKSLAPDKRPKQLALDPATTLTCGNRYQIILDPVDLDDVRSVTTSLDSEHRTAERAV
jgi:hypothetical protein